MSRETLLDEAIIKAKECGDWQLVEWLRMARGGESAARWYTGKFAELQAENDKMVMKLNAEHLVRQNVERENAKLRELLVGAFEDMDAWQKVIAGSNEWGYGKGCLDRLCKLMDAMQELGMEVEVR